MVEFRKSLAAIGIAEALADALSAAPKEKRAAVAEALDAYATMFPRTFNGIVNKGGMLSEIIEAIEMVVEDHEEEEAANG